MAYDYSKLRGRITEVCGHQAAFADAMGISQRSLSLKINNHIKFTQADIQKACGVLNIGCDEIGAYFFTRKVQAN